jgi:hypothetical protein
MVVKAGAETAFLSLDWQNFGGGAAALTGEVVAGEGSVAFLRSFDQLGIDWRNGSARALFRSEATGIHRRRCQYA